MEALGGVQHLPGTCVLTGNLSRDMSTKIFPFLFRRWRKNKAYSVLNIFGLAMGIACAGLIFLWIEDERSYDNFNVKKDRLYNVEVNINADGNVWTIGSTPRPLVDVLKTEIPGVRNAARVSDGDRKILLGWGDRSLYALGRHADSSVFSMFTLPFVAGDPKTAFNQIYSLVLTETEARKVFGPVPAASLIGKSLHVDNIRDYTVTGIVKDLPANSSLQFEWLAPFAIDLIRKGMDTLHPEKPLSWDGYGPFTYVELEPGVDPHTVNKELAGLIHRKNPQRNDELFLFPMKDWRLYDEFENGKQTGGGRIEYVHLLSLVAWIILLIACINFMNLATARSQQRAREIGVRKVLGAGRKGLAARFLLEALYLSALAGVLAVGIMALVLPAFNALVEKQLFLAPLRPAHWLGLLSIVVCCGLVAGSYPSFYLSSFRPIIVLKAMKLPAGSDAWVRKGLVVLQFSLSIAFIIATIIIFRQIQYVKERNLGFHKDRLVEIDMQHGITGKFDAIRQELLQTGVVAYAAMANGSILDGGNIRDNYDWPGKSVNLQVNIAYRNVSNDFILASGMKLLAGRDFTSAIDSSEVLVTATMARLMEREGGKGEGAEQEGVSINYAGVLGKVIRYPLNEEKTKFDYFTVAGVVADYIYGNLYGDPGPVILFCRPNHDWWANLVYIRTRAVGNASSVLAKIQTVIQRYNKGYPFQYAFVDEQFNARFKTEELMADTARTFAILAILISCLGLFGLAAYSAEQRTREIGIRKVLGASVAGITGLLSKDFLQLVAISCLIAFPVAGWLAHNWLQQYTYHIALSGWIFVAAGGVALLIAWVTIASQAIRAALANPVVALRNE
jgi:putative ABC transport system permease protein